MKHCFKSIDGAVSRVRQLEKINRNREVLLDVFYSHSILLRAIIDGKARYEPFMSGNGGEICVNGLRFSTSLDEYGVPILSGQVRAAIHSAEAVRR